MAFEAPVHEEQAYVPFSPINLLHFIAPLYISTDKLMVLESLPLPKLVSLEEQVISHISLIMQFGRRDSNPRCSSGASLSLGGPLMELEYLSALKPSFRLVAFALNGYWQSNSAGKKISGC